MIVSDYGITIADATADDVVVALTQLQEDGVVVAFEPLSLLWDGAVRFTARGYPTRVQMAVNGALAHAAILWPQRIYNSTRIEADA